MTSMELKRDLTQQYLMMAIYFYVNNVLLNVIEVFNLQHKNYFGH